MPEFVDKDVELITRSLPDWVNRERLKLLPRILRDWAGDELRNYVAGPSTKDRNRLIEELKAVGTYASKLTKALNILANTDDLFWIIRG